MTSSASVAGVVRNPTFGSCRIQSTTCSPLKSGSGHGQMRHVDHHQPATCVVDRRPEGPLRVVPGGAADVVRARHELPEAVPPMAARVDAGLGRLATPRPRTGRTDCRPRHCDPRREACAASASDPRRRGVSLGCGPRHRSRRRARGSGQARPVTIGQPGSGELGGRVASEASASVVILTYNRAELVLRAVASVQRQSARRLGTARGRRRIDGRYESPHRGSGGSPNPVRARDVNGGVAAAQNTGLDRAVGRHVLFLHSDDELMPECLRADRRARARAIRDRGRRSRSRDRRARDNRSAGAVPRSSRRSVALLGFSVRCAHRHPVAEAGGRGRGPVRRGSARGRRSRLLRPVAQDDDPRFRAGTPRAHPPKQRGAHRASRRARSTSICSASTTTTSWPRRRCTAIGGSASPGRTNGDDELDRVLALPCAKQCGPIAPGCVVGPCGRRPVSATVRSRSRWGGHRATVWMLSPREAD